VRVVLALFGSLAIQGAVIDWVATHRRHHAYTDVPGDPHSPHVDAGDGVGGLLRGLWYAHVGWMFTPDGTVAEVWAPVFYAVGARGFTSGLINVWPERSVAIHAALEAGEFAEANALVQGMRVFEDIRAEEMGGANVTGVKAALIAQGIDCGPTRPPSAWPLTSAQQVRLDAFLAANRLTAANPE
jgi:hypothetical protein